MESSDDNIKPINIDRLYYIFGNGKDNLSVFQKQAIYQWGREFEESVKAELKRQYERWYLDSLEQAIDYFIISIAFVLHYSSTTKFGRKRLYTILDEIKVTVDMFNRKEYSPDEYMDMLREDGINIKMKYGEK